MKISCLANQYNYDTLDLLFKLSVKGNSIYSLDLSDMKLAEFDFNFALFPNLRILDLSYNHFTSIPDSVFELKNLRKLTMKETKLWNISERIGNLSKLQYLNLQKNEIKSIPYNIGKLKELKYLNLLGNIIEYIPIEFYKLENLKVLKMMYKGNYKLKDITGNLNSLEIINIKKISSIILYYFFNTSL